MYSTEEKMIQTRKIIIVGGVAGGASVAARLRRLSEDVEIIIIERGSHVSFANCGLPYHIGGEITHRDQLLIQTPKGLYDRFNIEVRIETEVTHIDRTNKTLQITDLNTNESYQETYDQLVLSPGAEPLMPPLKGIHRPGHFALRNINDMDNIMQWNEQIQPKRAVVIGGGFIGLEMVEQLTRLGMHISLVEAQNQVLAPTDPDIAKWVEDELTANQIDVYLNNKVVAFEDPIDEENSKASTLVFEDGQRLAADLVILSMGVRPETAIVKEAGLAVGELGGIRVNDHMRTDDPNIWAVGDAIEVRHPVSKDWALIPLAGPANRQGRTAADNILGRATRYRGTWGTSVVRVFDQTIACTGLNEKQLQRAGMAYEAVHVHPFSHVTYYPNAHMLLIKLLFSPEDGKIYGAQIVGKDSVERRLDVLAAAIQGGMTVDDVAHLELSYAPAFGSPKDPVNIAAMVARNVINGDMRIAHVDEVASSDSSTIILDVSSPGEHANMSIPNSVNIPLNELRNRLSELPKEKRIIVYCFSGQRSYFAYRMLYLNGFDVHNLSGGIRNWKSQQPVIDKSSQNANSSLIAEIDDNQEESSVINQAINSFINNLEDKSAIDTKADLLESRKMLINEREHIIRQKYSLLEKKDRMINQKNEQINLGTIANFKHKYEAYEAEILKKYSELEQAMISIVNQENQLQAETQEINAVIDGFKNEIARINELLQASEASSLDESVVDSVNEFIHKQVQKDEQIDAIEQQLSVRQSKIINIEERIALQEKLLDEKAALLKEWEQKDDALGAEIVESKPEAVAY